MLQFLYIGIGGAMGAVSRHLISQSIDKLVGDNSPISLGILSINALGSFVISIMFFYAQEKYFVPSVHQFISIGFLGSLTTFSSYTLQSFLLIKAGKIYAGLFNIFVNNVLSLICALFAFYLIMILFNLSGK